MNIYENLRNLIINYMYGGVMPGRAEMAIELVTLIGTLAITFMPFYIVYRLIRRWF